MKTLLVGYKASMIDARALAALGDVTCHVLDIYDRHAIEKAHHLRAVCSAHLPAGDWDLVRFRTGPKLASGELSLDLLQECKRLKDAGARFELDYAGREAGRNDLLAKVFGKGARERSFAAAYQASVPGVAPLSLVSVPGCFCHRRTDEGGLALAETVAKALRETEGAQPLKFLDMGCGNGIVGFLAAAAARPRRLELVMVDSHSRAVEAAEMNSRALGIEAEIILADNGTPRRMDGTFDIFAGNPPYYSEYRIAGLFCETAQRALKPGGHAYFVCKNAAGLEPVVAEYFPEIEILRRRGYAVLHARAAAARNMV